jgi:DNA-binding IclR family transcriptional regulator
MKVIACLVEALEAGNTWMPYTPAKIAKKTGLNRTRVFRVLQSFEAYGYVSYYKGGYILGNQFLFVAEKMKGDVDAFNFTKSIVERLAQSTGDAAYLYSWQGHAIICMNQAFGLYSLQIHKEVGNKYPIYVGAAGLAILANIPEKEKNRIISKLEFVPFTEHTIIDLTQLRRRLVDVRTKGYAVTIEDYELGACAVSAPIFSHGFIMSAITLEIPTTRWSEKNLGEIIQDVVESAKQISEQLTYLS